MVCKKGIDVWLRVRMYAVNMLPVQTAWYTIFTVQINRYLCLKTYWRFVIAIFETSDQLMKNARSLNLKIQNQRKERKEYLWLTRRLNLDLFI